MRYPASEKLEIIKIVEQSHLPAKKTLDQLGIARRTFYRWYDRYVEGGPEALEDSPSRPSRVWNRISAEVQSQIIDMALEQSELSPRELAVRFTDEKRYFVSEATVYRLLKAHDLITSPAFVVIKAADEFRDKTMRPNEMWQTDFTYFKIIGWGWVYLSTVLDDFSRYIIAWKLCTTMRAQDVTETLELGLTASGCDSARVLHKPKLLSDNGPSYIAQEPHPAGELLPAGRSRTPDRSLRRALQSPTPPREPWQRDPGRRLLRQGLCHHRTTRKDQTTDDRAPALAAPQTRRLTSTKDRGRHSAKSSSHQRQMF